MSLSVKSECGEEIVKHAHDLAVCVDSALLDERAADGYAAYEFERMYPDPSDAQIEQFWQEQGENYADNIERLESLAILLAWLQENVA